MRIGVISDTHIPRRSKNLPDEVLNGFRDVQLILHAGDLIDDEVLAILRNIAPVEAVSGNVDPYEIHHKLGRRKMLNVEGFKIGLIHGDGSSGTTLSRVQQAFEGMDCVVFGHSHMPYNAWHGKTLYFNPGSPTDRRASPNFSFGILEITDTIKGEIIYF